MQTGPFTHALRLCVTALAVTWPLALGWNLHDRSLASFQRTISLHLVVAHFLAAWLLWARAAQETRARLGWALLASSHLSSFVYSAVVALVPTPGTLEGLSAVVHSSLLLLPGLFQSLALILWPWRQAHDTSRRTRLMGGVLFATSLVLLFWYLGIWQLEQDQARLSLIFMAVRVVLAGGLALYFLAEAPGRLHGPLGLLLGANACNLGLVMLVRHFVVFSPNQASPWFGIAVLAPLLMALGALSSRPLDSAEAPGPPSLFLRVLPLIPYLLSGLVLGLVTTRSNSTITVPVLAFLCVSFLFQIQGLFLSQDLRQANLNLESKVLQRTKALEASQALLLQTERLNTQALVGAGLSHDLKNLLAAVRTSAELLVLQVEEGEAPAPKNLQRLLAATQKASELATLSGSLAHLGTPSSGSSAAASTDLQVLMRHTAPLLELILGRTCTLETRMPTGELWVDMAEGHLNQILLNLVGNARDAMPQGGRLSIAIEEQGLSAVAIRVSDTGTGMEARLCEHIFEPLFTTKPVGKGTGLGLATVKLLLDQAGGSIRVESTPGQGSTFHMEVPRAVMEARSE